MPLYIADKPMTDINQIIQAVQQLPEPLVIDNIDAPFDMTKAVLSLQRESTYVNTADPSNRFAFMGSLGVYNCLFLYLHNQTEHLGIQLDNILPSNFTSLLSRFKDLTSLEAVLVGGCENDSSSKLILENSLKVLLATTETLKIDITIKYQKMLSANRFDPETDAYRSVYNIFCQRLAAFNRQYLANQINMNTIPHYPVACLKNKHLAEILPTAFKNLTEKETIETMAFCLSFLGETKFPADDSDQVAAKLIDCFNQLGENLFIRYIFSHDFYSAFLEIRKNHLPFGSVKMCDFVVELATGTFHHISCNTPLPYEGLRRLRIMFSLGTPDYRVAYSDGAYKRPSISPGFATILKVLEGIFSSGKEIGVLDILTILNITGKQLGFTTGIINRVAQYTHLWIQEKKEDKETELFFSNKTGNRLLLFVPVNNQEKENSAISALSVTQPPPHQ